MAMSYFCNNIDLGDLVKNPDFVWNFQVNRALEVIIIKNDDFIQTKIREILR